MKLFTRVRTVYFIKVINVMGDTFECRTTSKHTACDLTNKLSVAGSFVSVTSF